MWRLSRLWRRNRDTETQGNATNKFGGFVPEAENLRKRDLEGDPFRVPFLFSLNLFTIECELIFIPRSLLIVKLLMGYKRLFYSKRQRAEGRREKIDGSNFQYLAKVLIAFDCYTPFLENQWQWLKKTYNFIERLSIAKVHNYF